MAVTFPPNPQVGDTVTDPVTGVVWEWDGVKWTHAGGGAAPAAFLPLAGGTMTGPITLAGDAVNPLEAVPLQQLPSGGGGPPFMGVTDGSDAAPGEVGEYITATSPPENVPLFPSSPQNLIQIDLTAGDWDVWGTISINFLSGTNITSVGAAISTVGFSDPGSAANRGGAAFAFTSNAFPVGLRWPVGTTRMSLAVATTVYLVCAIEAVSTEITGSGFIAARRVR